MVSPRRSPILRKGTLTMHGYAMRGSLVDRRKAIRKAIRYESPLSIFRKLNYLAVLNKNTHPSHAAIYMRDRNYVRKNYM